MLRRRLGAVRELQRLRAARDITVGVAFFGQRTCFSHVRQASENCTRTVRVLANPAPEHVASGRRATSIPRSRSLNGAELREGDGAASR